MIYNGHGDIQSFKGCQLCNVSILVVVSLTLGQVPVPLPEVQEGGTGMLRGGLGLKRMWSVKQPSLMMF